MRKPGAPRPKQLPPFPKILADELIDAHASLRGVPPDELERLLALYRKEEEDRRTFPAAWGLSPHGELMREKIARLDAAYKKLHRFNAPDGVADYLSARGATVVESMLQSGRASGPRDREGHGNAVSLDRIAKYLAGRDYQRSNDKATLVKDAVDHFAVSASKVRRAITRHGLARKKRGNRRA